MNGFVKIPMQFLILLVGAMVFTFYTLFQGPINYNSKQLELARNGVAKQEIIKLESQFAALNEEKKQTALYFLEAKKASNTDLIEKYKRELSEQNEKTVALRQSAAAEIKKSDPLADTNDTNYIFLHFVIHHLPQGLVGLLIAIIFLAAWGSIAAALNSLASTCVVDWHQQIRLKERTDK